ncbi:Hsp20/alpha crystallin family protein [Patescibacteria group bacterium]
MSSFFEKLQQGKEEVKPEKNPDVKPKVEEKQPKKPEPQKTWFKPAGKLAVDIFQTETDIVIQTPIAGVKKADLDISIENDMVTIRGERKKPAELEEKNYFYEECYWGPFVREIILPTEGDPSRIKALMKDGLLTLRIPRIEREKKRKVEIK